MGKFLKAFIALFLVASCGRAPEVPPKAGFDVPRLDDIKIDGDASDWGQRGYSVPLIIPAAGEIRPESSHFASIKVGWNAKGLIVLAQLSDDVWRESENIDALYEGDSVEFFMAPKVGAPDLGQWLVAPGMDPKFPEPRRKFVDSRKDEKLKAAPAEIEVARTAPAGKCILEALVPFAALGIEPKVGTELGFQFFANDSDGPGDSWYKALWFPSRESWFDTSKLHILRLAERSGPPVRVRHTIDLNLERMQLKVKVVAAPELNGKRIALTAGQTTLAFADLGEAGQRCLAELKMAVPDQGQFPPELTLVVPGETPEPLTFPNIKKDIARMMVWEDMCAFPAVFRVNEFPTFEFKRPLLVERLIGPYEIKVKVLNSNYEPVGKADKPGRYGAVVSIHTADGRVYRRFNTLFCYEGSIHPWFPWEWDLDVSLKLPKALGISATALALMPEDVSELVKGPLGEYLVTQSDSAVMLAGLFEAGKDGRGGFYESAWQRDRRWWLKFKRELYGWDREYPEPFVCPKPKEGAPAPVIRAGTLAEARMKPGAPAAIDAVLKEWEADTDEAFAVCVARHGVIVLHKAYGSRDGAPMTVKTKSWMASTTKMMSGSLIMMLVDQGRIRLEDTVGKYLAPLRHIETNKPMTIRNLYTHTAGFEGHWGSEFSDWDERMAFLLPYLRVGERYEYDGTGLELATKILEAVSAETLPDFYRNHLLGPLGCPDTDVAGAAGDANSVPLDMAKIAQMLLNKGAYGDKRFFSEATFKLMLPRPLTDILGPDEKQVYGIGTHFFEGEGLGEGTFAHGAASSATTRIDPVNDLVIIMTRNTAGRNFGKYHQKFIDAVKANLL